MADCGKNTQETRVSVRCCRQTWWPFDKIQAEFSLGLLTFFFALVWFETCQNLVTPWPIVSSLRAKRKCYNCWNRGTATISSGCVKSSHCSTWSQIPDHKWVVIIDLTTKTFLRMTPTPNVGQLNLARETWEKGKSGKTAANLRSQGSVNNELQCLNSIHNWSWSLCCMPPETLLYGSSP